MFISVILSCTLDKGKLMSDEDKPSNTLVCDTNTYTYNADVKAIIDTKCIGCHASTSPYGSLASYTVIKNKALVGSLLSSLKGEGYSLMPPTGKLSDCEIQGIESWITAGAPNN